MFTDHNNITFESIESTYQHVQCWKSLIQEFGDTILYIKGYANIVADDCSWIPMAYHAHKSAKTTLEEYTRELLCLDSLFISDNIDCLSLNVKEI